MRAVLLANTRVELISTDSPPMGAALTDRDRCALSCMCRVRDAACLTCGTVCGYHVINPCTTCIESCNNGHLWMFLQEMIYTQERFKNSVPLKWASISKDGEIHDELDSFPSSIR